MKRQPRNPLRDKLVNERLISIAYGQIGRYIYSLQFVAFTVNSVQAATWKWFALYSTLI